MLIDRVWAEQPGRYFCLSTKNAAKTFKTYYFSARGSGTDVMSFREIPAFLKEHSDCDIYFCPHGFNKPTRRKEFAVMPNLLWADLDEADPRTIKYKPTIAIESSPGRFVGLWFTDKPISEELNQRLSYAVGADNSGWDLTQVLRVPSTTNYKYHSMPRVRILWTDGPSYKVSTLDRDLPELEGSSYSGELGDAPKLFKKYERKLPHWLRRELISGKPTEGKRSEMLWKITQTLIECGVPSDDVFVMIKASPWNKFAGRRSEDVQLQREIDKSLNKRFVNKRKPTDNDEDDAEGEPEFRLIFKRMSEVEEEEIDWLWYPYLALGELTILEGDPGIGKSFVMQRIAQMVCDGMDLPNPYPAEEREAIKGQVVYFDMENSSGTVTKPRLTNSGLKNYDSFIQCEEPFSIDNEEAWDEICNYLEQERPKLIVFDTLNTYLGGADAFKGHEVASTFARFRELAKRYNCAVCVLRHLTKSSKERALYRGQGSIQLAGLARIVMTVGAMPEDPDIRVLAITKINVAPAPKALTFTLDSVHSKKGGHGQSKVVWGEYVDLTADDIVAAPTKGPNSSGEDAKDFLKASLADGQVEAVKLEKMAESRGISLRTLQRAADGLGVTKKSVGFGKNKRSFWSLPD